MTPEERDALWRCSECKVAYVVPCLARDCEAEHARLARLWAAG